MSARRSVLYLATFDPTVSVTGTTTRGRLFLDSFSRRYDTHLVHLEEPQAEGKDLDLAGRLSGVHAVPYSTPGYFLYSRGLYRAAQSVLARHPVDLIFADFEKAGFYAQQLSRLSGLPYVYNSHNVEYRRYLDFARREKLRYPFVPYMYLLERRAVQGAALTVAISEKDAAVFRRWVPEGRVLALPAAFDEGYYHLSEPAQPAGPPVVLMVGNYRNPGNREGAHLLVERILPAVANRRPEVIFRAVGKNFPAGLSHPNLQVAGFVEDLPAEYRRAALVVVPITMGGGIKIKAIEGLACGRTVISTPKGAEGIEGGFGHLLIRELEAFPEAILSALEQPATPAPGDWERLAGGYGVRRGLETLHGRIESLLAARQAEVRSGQTRPYGRIQLQ